MVTLCENTRSRSTLKQLQKRRSLGKKMAFLALKSPNLWYMLKIATFDLWL